MIIKWVFNMDKKELFNKIIEYSNSKKSQSTLFIEKNTDVILKALEYGISIKDIYNILISEKCIDVAYITFYQKIRKLKKDRLQSETTNITDLNISNDRSSITFPADETPNSLTSITKTEETQEMNDTKQDIKNKVDLSQLSMQERIEHNRKVREKIEQKLAAQRKDIVDIQKDQEKFIWKPSIAEETQEISHTKIEHNQNEEQKPLSKNKQKLEALKKKLDETGGIIDGNKLKDNQFVWTPTRRE